MLGMKSLRLLFAALVTVGLVTVVSVHGSLTQVSSSSLTCTPEVLTAALNANGPAMPVQGISAYGCDGLWAYVWAEVGVAPHTISVTEVLAWPPTARGWRVANRAVVCDPRILPAVIYHQGCFSN